MNNTIKGIAGIIAGTISVAWAAYELGKYKGYEEGWDIGYETGELNGKTKALNDILKQKERFREEIGRKMGNLHIV